jgi:bla regulator protein BlaR1
MGNLFSSLLAMSIAGSAVVGLMLLLRPVTAKIFPAKWQYGIGKMAIAFFLLPVFLFAGKLPLVQPVIESYPAEPSIIQKALPALPSNGFVDAMDTLMEKYLSVELMEALLLIWFVGAMVFAGWHFYCYRRFSKQLRTDSFPVPDDTAAVLLSSCKAPLRIPGDVKLMLNPKIKSPMLVGLRYPMILLPTSNMQEIDLKLVLTHELIHLKRKDLWVKMLALLAGTVHWVNPLAHVLRKDVSTWGELSCDEALASKMSHEERKLYGEAILNTLDNHSGMNTAFCSSLCESTKHIERRLTMLLNVKKMKKHIAVFAVVAIVAIASIGIAVAALAADNAPNPGASYLGALIPSDTIENGQKPSFTREIEETPKVTAELPEQVKKLSAEELAGAIKMDMGTETLISVKLSDERKFTPEEWQEILKKIESGEIRVEAE